MKNIDNILSIKNKARVSQKFPKMRVEIPDLKRCCFFMPLRYGLIVWGYIKLIPLLALFSLAMYSMVGITKYPRYSMLEEILWTSLFLLTLFIDICVTIVFLIGGHRKSAKLLHVYYIYSIVILCLYMLCLTGVTASDLVYIAQHSDYTTFQYIARVMPLARIRLLIGVSNFGIQVYVIILTRSEVNKLNNSCTYRFSNLTIEAEHTLENETKDQGIVPMKGSSENGIDSQFIGIINQIKNVDRENFNYNRL